MKIDGKQIPFALILSSDGIALAFRSGEGWEGVGELDPNSENLPQDLADLRAKAEARAPGRLRTRLIIPDDQIRHMSLELGLLGDEQRHARVRQALDGATPYRLDELVYDYVADGALTHVAAVAVETLNEAETFARQAGFNPVSFGSLPGAGGFPDEADFGSVSGDRRLDDPAGTKTPPRATAGVNRRVLIGGLIVAGIAIMVAAWTMFSMSDSDSDAVDAPNADTSAADPADQSKVDIATHPVRVATRAPHLDHPTSSLSPLSDPSRHLTTQSFELPPVVGAAPVSGAAASYTMAPEIGDPAIAPELALTVPSGTAYKSTSPPTAGVFVSRLSPPPSPQRSVLQILALPKAEAGPVLLDPAPAKIRAAAPLAPTPDNALAVAIAPSAPVTTPNLPSPAPSLANAKLPDPVAAARAVSGLDTAQTTVPTGPEGDVATPVAFSPEPDAPPQEAPIPDVPDVTVVVLDNIGNVTVPRLRPKAPDPELSLEQRTELAKAASTAPRLRPVQPKSVIPTYIVASAGPNLRPANFKPRIPAPQTAAPTPSTSPQTATAAAPEEGQPSTGRVRATPRGEILRPSTTSAAAAQKAATTRNRLVMNRVSLIGMSGAPSNRNALVRMPSGRIYKVGVGDTLDGGRILAIGQGELRYLKGGRNVTLKMPRG